MFCGNMVERFSSHRWYFRKTIPYRNFHWLLYGFNKHYKKLFAYYFESSEDVTVKNNMKPQTYSCIVMGLSGNVQDYQNVFDIYTGMILKHRTLK